MATDSTELTFVRCPSCRSLVPAVSSRCRMCGAGLDASDELAEEEQAAEESPIDEVAAKGVGESPVSDEEDFEDPLGDYLQADDEEEEDETELPDSDGDEEEAEKKAEEDAEPAVEAKKPKLKVESGNKKGGLSFKKETNRQPRKSKSESAQESRQGKKVAAKGKSEPKQPQKQAASQEKPQKEERSSRRDRRKSERPAREARPQKPQPKQEKRMEAQLAEAPSPSFTQRPEQEGRLFGWLVSFKSANGDALELREGKFFVTGSSLKDNDLVLEDPTVSTPHALVAVSADRGLLVQDLMSERGVFLRTPEDDTYRKEEETVRLEHGDWVRFGDEEFLISLVPTPPRR